MRASLDGRSAKLKDTAQPPLRRSGAACLEELRPRNKQPELVQMQFPLLIPCRTSSTARAYATLGEICGAMREVFGTYREASIT